MPLTYEHGGYKKPAKINTYMLTRVELLITLCYEIPCTKKQKYGMNETLIIWLCSTEFCTGKAGGPKVTSIRGCTGALKLEPAPQRSLE